MKKLITLCALIIASISMSIAQTSKLDINKKDDMTGDLVQATSWEKVGTSANMVYLMRFIRVNSNMLIDLKVTTRSVEVVPEDADLMLKLSNDSLITANSIGFEVAELGKGAVGLANSEAFGINPKYLIDGSMLKSLSTSPVIKMRVYLKESFIEIEPKGKKADAILEQAKIFLLAVQE